jgi:hypothetical protein
MEPSHTKLKKEIRNICLFFVTVTYLFLLGGCSKDTSTQTIIAEPTNTPIIIDSGFLSGIPCSAPCFLGSTPGITNKDEVITILEENDIYSFCEEKVFTNSAKSVLRCTSEYYFWFEGSNLTEISVEPKFTTITLGQVISKYGPPTSVDLITGGTNGVHLIICIIYENSQFVLHLTDPSSEESTDNDIQPESKILWIDYLSEARLRSFTHNKCIVPWKGYGIYELIPGC